MRFEGRQRAAVLDRCWSIHLSITRAFILPEDFHVEFPVTVESALVTGTLHLTAPIGSDLTLSLREEYDFDRQRLVVSRYSYNLIDDTGSNVLCADNLPFHRTDYRNRSLTNPPHHIHDQQDRVYSFDGNVYHFIAHVEIFRSTR